MEIGEYAISINPIYNSPNGNSFGFYYDLDDSIFLIKNFYIFNYKRYHKLKKILFDLLLILDKKKGKCNTFFVQSPPNGGKQIFFNTIIHYFFW